MTRALRVIRALPALVLRVAVPSGAMIAVLGHASMAFAAPTAGARVHPYAASVAAAAQRFGIPETWIWHVMQAESDGNARAVSRAGAMGLMQIMPATWAMLSARHDLGDDPFDTRSNIFAGAAYLRTMWDRYRDVSLMLAAYNAGPGRVDAYLSGRGGLPRETIAYVARIAPRLGASGLASRAAVPIRGAVDWRRSALFGARSGVSDVDENPAATMQSDRLMASTRKSNAQPNDRARNPLFVPLSDKDR